MENNKLKFIKTDTNVIINEKAITRVKKMNECLDACVKSDCCTHDVNTYRICKLNSPEGYNRLNKYFE